VEGALQETNKVMGKTQGVVLAVAFSDEWASRGLWKEVMILHTEMRWVGRREDGYECLLTR